MFNSLTENKNRFVKKLFGFKESFRTSEYPIFDPLCIHINYNFIYDFPISNYY